MKSLLLWSLLVTATSQFQREYHDTAKICEECRCIDENNTYILDCNNRNFSHILSTWPNQNKTIRVILSGNYFNILPKLPISESQLDLVLSYCQIQSLDSEIFEGCPNTKYVDLSHNLIDSTQLSSEVFRGLMIDNKFQSIAIEDLNLAYNQIHTLYKDVFQFLPHLTRLNLEGNDFRVLDIHTQLVISSLTKLSSLNLAGNGLTELVPNAIKNLKNLAEINLSNNNLDFIPRSLSEVGSSLEILILDGNPIISLEWKTLSTIPNLVELSANNLSALKVIEAKTFESNTLLTKVNLANNKILTKIDDKAFNRSAIIKEIYINDNNLFDISDDLLPWHYLDYINFSNNPLICSCNLYTIVQNLKYKIIRNQDGPTCLHPFSDNRIQVYSLKHDICNSPYPLHARRIVYQRISIPLAILFAVLGFGVIIAIWLVYTRWRRFTRRHNGLLLSRVVYTPINIAS